MNINDGVLTLPGILSGAFSLINIHESATAFNNWPVD